MAAEFPFLIGRMSNKNPRISLMEGSSSSLSIDHLTSLPESLRLHILSLLPFKSAVQTSVLSSQWRHLYKKRAENLAFFLPINFSPSDVESSIRGGRPAAAGDGVTGVGLDSLHLVVRGENGVFSCFFYLPHWLALAARRSVQDITINLDQPTDLLGFPLLNQPTAIIPYHLLTSLVRLTLVGTYIAHPPNTFINLASLDVLNLYRVWIADSDLQALITGCYLLKSLDIRQCSGLVGLVVPGTGLWLRSVTIVDCPGVSHIRIMGRWIRRFHYCGQLLSNYRLDKILKLELEDVYVSCGGRGMQGMVLDGVAPGVLQVSNWWPTLGRLSHVRILTLCSRSLQYIAALGNFYNLPCLRELQLLMMTMTKFNFMDIWNFFSLCFCPGLEKLFIEFPPHTSHLSLVEFLNVKQEQPTAGLFTNLKTIKINRFEGHQYQMLLVKALLWKATCLESLLIIAPQVRMGEFTQVHVGEFSKYSCHSHALHVLRMELDSLVKSSENAKIVVREDDDHRLRPTHEVYC